MNIRRWFYLLLFNMSLFLVYTLNAQTPVQVASYIDSVGILYPEIVFRQSILESGWFKSPYYLKTKNLFGFRFKKSYIRFNKWQESVDYYKTWQLNHYTNMDEDYYHFLIRVRYASSNDYIKTLKRIRIKSYSYVFNKDIEHDSK